MLNHVFKKNKFDLNSWLFITSIYLKLFVLILNKTYTVRDMYDKFSALSN